MSNIKKTLLCLFAAMVVTGPLFAVSGYEVMKQVHDKKVPSYTHTLVKMDLIEQNGTTQNRVMEEWSMDKDDKTSAVIVFRSPASVKGTRFLLIDKKGGESDKWIYLPSLKTTRRIASSEGDKPFMGSDATYDDLGGRDLDDDDDELMEESVTQGGYTCWKVKCTPKPNGPESQYGYRVVYVDQNTKLPVREEGYDKQGSLLKVLDVQTVKHMEDYDIPMVNFLQNVQSGHSTRLAITNIELDKPVSEKVFTQNFLNTGRM
jgi:hypothetical protein